MYFDVLNDWFVVFNKKQVVHIDSDDNIVFDEYVMIEIKMMKIKWDKKIE